MKPGEPRYSAESDREEWDGVRQIWRINLLGILTAQRSGQEIARFRTLKTAALLGYLAYEARPQSRETLAGLLWPDSDLGNGRNSLSVALNSLRTQLEPPEVEFGSVLIADRNFVSLNPGAVTTDIAEFRALLTALKKLSDSDLQRIPLLQRAVDLYRGRLLEGLYEDWIVQEAQRLEETFFNLLDQLTVLLYKSGEYHEMQRCAERSINMAPWREAGHRHLIFAFHTRGQSASALRHYQHWQQNLKGDSEAASVATRALIAQIERSQARGQQPDRTEIEQITLRATLPQEGAQVQSPEPESTPPTLPTPEPPQAQAARLLSDACLPLRRTRFFGRRVQLQQLVHLFAAQEAPEDSTGRLVTLTGMGGSGKTRLAVEASYRLLSSYQGRLWFIALASLSSPALLDIALRDALPLLPDPQAAPLDQVVEFLSRSPSLLVLDNFEALLPAGAAWLTLLLERLPGVACLVTSRQKLEVDGEVEMPVKPLPVPKQDATLGVEKLLRYAGVQLFVDRARFGRADFGLTKRNAEAVSGLCHALEGLPLALELAAARSSALSPRQLLEHWEERDSVLRSSRRDLPHRHRSIQAAIETSYNLLSVETQEFFKKQWVFHGGWTTDAATQVCSEPNALHLAVQLRSCSLLFQQERVETVRFSCLEMLRDFAGAQLSPAERAALQDRHAHYFLEQIEVQSLDKARQTRQMARFQADLDNYRAALDWFAATDSGLYLHLTAALWPWWEATSNHGEGRTQLERALREAPDAPAAHRAWASLGLGRLIYHQDFAAARPWLEEALRLFRELDERRGIAMALCYLSTLLINMHESGARECAQEALELARLSQDAFMETEASYCLGVIDLGMGKLEQARSLLEPCIAFYQQNEDPRNQCLVLDILAMTVWAMQDWERAEALFAQSHLLARRLGWVFMEAHALWGVSAVARAQGRAAQALETARESARLVQEGKLLWFVPYALANLAHAEIEVGDVKRAVTLLGAADAQHEALGTPLMPLFFPEYERYKTKAQTELEKVQFETLWEKGRTLSSQEALAFGLQE